jgi:hypothetical protein
MPAIGERHYAKRGGETMSEGFASRGFLGRRSTTLRA